MGRLEQSLPKYEDNIFDQVCKAFDAHEYNRVLTLSDKILYNHPHHGETMSMKGLALYNLDEKEEGMKLIKKGIGEFPQADLSWHCLGICHKSEKNWLEAVKCCKQSAMIDPKGISPLRDWVSCSIQQEDWPSFLEASRRIVGLKSNIRGYWTALSCAHYLNGSPKLAAAVLDTMIEVIDAGDNPAEQSEIYLYRAELELIMEMPKKCVEILKKNDNEIADVTEKTILRAKAFTMLKQTEKATTLWYTLLKMGISEADALVNIAKLHRVPMDDQTHLPLNHNQVDVDNFVAEYCATFVSICDKAVQTNSKCDCAKRFPLDCVPLAEFEARLEAYIKPYVLRMIPSVTFVLKSLYTYYGCSCEQKGENCGRIAIIEKVFKKWEHQLERGDYSSFEKDGEKKNNNTECIGATTTKYSSSSHVIHNPALILWVYQFLASHYFRIGDYENAHFYCDKAIDHTPTIEMLYLLKAKVYKRQGKLKEAAELADKARILDLQDKYLNVKAAKYFFRLGDVEKGEGLLQLFMKECSQNDTYLKAIELQTSWYEREVGRAFMLRGDVISALQNYLLFERHHQDNYDGFVDFHNYFFRKCNLRQYLASLDMLQHIGYQRFFCDLVPFIVEAYLAVEQHGEELNSKHVERPKPTMSNSHDKAILEEDTSRIKLYKQWYLKDIDLSYPLFKARKYVKILLEYRPLSVITHLLVLDVFSILAEPPMLLIARSLKFLCVVREGGILSSSSDKIGVHSSDLLTTPVNGNIKKGDDCQEHEIMKENEKHLRDHYSPNNYDNNNSNHQYHHKSVNETGVDFSGAEPIVGYLKYHTVSIPEKQKAAKGLEKRKKAIKNLWEIQKEKTGLDKRVLAVMEEVMTRVG